MDKAEDNKQSNSKPEEHEAAENMRCVSFTWQEGITAGGQNWGPWTSEKASHDGITATRTVDESHSRTSYYLNMPGGKEYFFPDGKKEVIDQKQTGPDGYLRVVKAGTAEDKSVHAALNSFQFDSLPSCQLEEHQVQSGESLWSIAKDDVIKAPVEDGTIQRIVDRMARENQLDDPDRILAGQSLNIPAPFKLEDRHGKPM